MQTPTQELQSFLVTLNDEADIAAEAARQLDDHPVGEWKALLASHDEWRRFGTFEAILTEANQQLYKDPHRAQAMIEVVLEYADDLPDQEGAAILKPLLAGLARKEYANVLYVHDQHELALEQVKRALAYLSGRAALEIVHGDALLVYSQIQHKLGRTADALGAVRRAAQVFEDHYQYRRQEIALEICGQMLMEQKGMTEDDYKVAQQVYQTAYTAAERLEDPIALLRIDNALGLCAVYLHDVEEARYRLTRALTGLEQRGMHEAMQHTIFNMALEARERHELDDALETLHGVYAELLDRNMPRAAAQVLVELGDTVTQLTNETVYARETTRSLAETMIADHRLPLQIRNAMDYLRAKTEVPESPSFLHDAFATVREFLRIYAGSPTAEFAV